MSRLRLLALLALLPGGTADADDAALALVRAAREQVGVTVRYDPAYRALDYPAGYRPGDLVTWRLPPGVPHIGIVTNASREGRPLILHNIGSGTREEDVEPFLLAISDHVEEGFGPEDAGDLAAAITSLEIGEELIRELTVVCEGREIAMRIQGVMDDHDAPDLYVFAPEPLAGEIEQELLARLE